MLKLLLGPGRRAMILASVLWVATPAPGWTWGSNAHHYIAQNYSKHLPTAIDGLRTYDAYIDAHVMDPDSRKPYTPGEAPRHFIDIDFYPEFAQGTLSHDRATLEAEYGAATVLDKGIVPWAVGEVVTTLTQQFQAQQWSNAATTIADLCHYVGDANQPLHCTQNYDGQYTGNNGIHSRYESSMMTSSRVATLVTPVTPVTYHGNVVDEMFDLITASNGGVPTILQADNTAKALSGGSFNTVYYNSLWSNTETMTRVRINAATVAIASFVYTAWVNAGMPPVPGSSAASVGPVVAGGVQLAAGPSPFHGVLSVRYAGTGPLSIDVFDVRGARVERLIDGASGAGSVSWRPGAGAAPGLYVIRRTTPESSVTRRVTLLD